MISPGAHPIPILFEGCTAPERERARIPHLHCPHCGAIANIHCRSGGGISECVGCDACLLQDRTHAHA